MSLTLQFTPQDIEHAVERWRTQAIVSEKARDQVGKVLGHDLLSPLVGLTDLGAVVLFHETKTQKLKDHYETLFIKNPLARAYIQNIHSLGRLLFATSEDLSNLAEGSPQTKKGRTLDVIARHHYDYLKSLSNYTPLTPVVQSIIPLNETQLWYINRADVSAETVIYIANRLFNPNRRQDKFYLSEDMSSFWLNLVGILAKDNICVVNYQVQSVTTSVDYVANAIEPLIWNARDHAFGQKNTKQKTDYWVGVSGFFEKIPATEKIENFQKRPSHRGNYTVRVMDGGYGIPKKHFPHIFEKGYSTKTDKTTSHGIGLWGVKQFVETYGGQINVQTQRGKGTTFTFTIPYSQIQN